MPYADRSRQRAASRESARRRRAARRAMAEVAAGATRSRVEPSHQPGGLSPAALSEILAQEIAIVRESMPCGSHERPRIVAQLAAVALRVYEVGDLAARVEMLERTFGGGLGTNRVVQHEEIQ